MIKMQINQLVKQRREILDIDYHDVKADELQAQIEEIIKDNLGELDDSFILETYTKFGIAPSLLYDDSGYFCVCEDGAQDSPISFDEEETTEKQVQNMMFYVQNRDFWQPTIREAVRYWLEHRNDE